MRALGLLRSPLVWLFATTAGIFVHLEKAGLLEPKRSPDTVTYELLATGAAPAEILSGIRTFGYPLFLRLMELFEVSADQIPAVHAGAYFLAVHFFWFATRAYTGSSWLALAAALPLAWTGLLRYVPYIQPDLLAPTLVIVAISLLLLLATRPRSPWIWSGLTVVTFAAYQAKPVFVFLVALIPLMGPVLRACWGASDWRSMRAWTIGLVAATVLPFVLYGSIRFSMVGKFGLVPLGGYEMIGIAGSFLDEELIYELPHEFRSSASRILAARNKRGYRPYRLGSDTVKWHLQYGQNQWWIAEPIVRPIVVEERAARGLGDDAEGFGSDRAMLAKWEAVGAGPQSGLVLLALNDRLSQIAWAVIARRPLLWAKWAVENVRYGLDRTLQLSAWTRWLPVLLVISLPLVALRPRPARSDSRTTTKSRLFALCLLGVSFLLVKLLLLSVVSWPFDRYLAAGLLFVPTGLAAVLFELWAVLLSPMPDPEIGTAADA